MKNALKIMVAIIAVIGVYGQSVIVNEMSQGSDGNKEWVELLVVTDGTDMRGWELGDNDDGTWHSILELTTSSDWSNVAQGTIIVFYNSGDIDGTITAAGGEDTDFSDKKVLIASSNTTYVTDTGGWPGSGVFGNSDRDDCAAIRNGSDVMIHDMAVTHPSATVESPTSGNVKYYTSNSAGGTSNSSNWTQAASTSGTPGAGNGGDNTTWIDTSLPVELSLFKSAYNYGYVKLYWLTDSEIENQGFILERALRQAQGPDEWIEIANFGKNPDLLGQGSTTEKTDYSYIDKLVKVGETYSYRLSDVDYRGNITPHPAITVTVLAKDEDLKPGKLAMHPAYPNPFNPDVKLSFELNEAVQTLALEIYDLNGALIQTVTSGAHDAGSYDFDWRGQDAAGNLLPSGVYLVRLAGAGEVQIQRITLLR